jgi:tetratricopeptide (TPR) repeat protein
MPRLIRFFSLLILLLTVSACNRASVEPQPEPDPSVNVDSQPDPRTEVTLELSNRKIVVTDCLLRSSNTKRHSTTALPSEDGQLANLMDNDARTISTLSAAPDAPLDLIYEFSETATPQELVVLLPERLPPGASIARVEVLGSSLSPATGFQFLRADPLENTKEVQRFRLRPQGVKWVMLRFQPATGSQRVAVAEIALLGKWELPKSAYAFKESPVKAIELLAGLQAVQGVQVALDVDEAKLVADVSNGRFKTGSLAEAAFFAGGVRDAQKRKQYLEQINALAKEAKKELGGVKSPTEKGDKLLTWLHNKALVKGYKADQSDLHTILDEHDFNCLSSAILYVALADKLGLDARGIEVPDHAFAIVYDKKDHADVETTTPRGFNPQRDAIEEFANKTNFVYIPDSNRDKRREVRDAGLAALVYYNHGVDRLQEKRYPEALAAFFRALSLDRESARAVQNALVTLARWGLHLSEQGRFEDAIAVAAAGVNLAQQMPRLRMLATKSGCATPRPSTKRTEPTLPSRF